LSAFFGRLYILINLGNFLLKELCKPIEYLLKSYIIVLSEKLLVLKHHQVKERSDLPCWKVLLVLVDENLVIQRLLNNHII